MIRPQHDLDQTPQSDTTTCSLFVSLTILAPLNLFLPLTQWHQIFKDYTLDQKYSGSQKCLVAAHSNKCCCSLHQIHASIFYFKSVFLSLYIEPIAHFKNSWKNRVFAKWLHSCSKRCICVYTNMYKIPHHSTQSLHTKGTKEQKNKIFNSETAHETIKSLLLAKESESRSAVHIYCLLHQAIDTHITSIVLPNNPLVIKMWPSKPVSLTWTWALC